MNQETRLPRNAKEGALYGAIICTLTVLLMTTLNVTLAVGEFNKDAVLTILKSLPIFWVIVMIIEPVLIGRLAPKIGQEVYGTNGQFQCPDFIPHLIHCTRNVSRYDAYW